MHMQWSRHREISPRNYQRKQSRGWTGKTQCKLSNNEQQMISRRMRGNKLFSETPAALPRGETSTKLQWSHNNMTIQNDVDPPDLALTIEVGYRTIYRSEILCGWATFKAKSWESIEIAYRKKRNMHDIGTTDTGDTTAPFDLFFLFLSHLRG